MEMIKHILQLSKVKITIAVSFTTITGYVLGNGKFDFGWWAVTLGIFLLACGASVLNHIQELRTDSLMIRTRNRPLPGKKVSIITAWIIATAEIVTGSLILWYYVSFHALLLGWLALLWYNLIYTYLKRVTPHAVIPGSVIGAIPPVAGWVASGAGLNDFRVYALALFFFVWQVPHFYLLVIKYGSQYQQAGFPALTERYKEYIIRFMIFLWIVTTAIAAMLLVYFQVIQSTLSILLILAASIWLIVIFAIPVLRKGHRFLPFKYFIRINYYVVFIIIVLNIDNLF